LPTHKAILARPLVEPDPCTTTEPSMCVIITLLGSEMKEEGEKLGAARAQIPAIYGGKNCTIKTVKNYKRYKIFFRDVI
jgi:hypothetical protein